MVVNIHTYAIEAPTWIIHLILTTTWHGKYCNFHFTEVNTKALFNHWRRVTQPESINRRSGIWKQSLCSSVQFSSVAQSCLTLCDPMNRSMPRLPLRHQLPEFIQTHVQPVFLAPN